MPAYWVKFKSGSPGCVEADTEAAALVAARMVTGRDPTECERLPYPAHPRLVMKKYTDPDGKEYTVPSFCFRPEECKGRSCCPQNLSCTE